MTSLAVEFPSKPRLSRSEELTVLRSGPAPKWFRPWAEHAHVAPLAPHPWGYIHIHGEWGTAPVWELVGFWSPDELRWGLQTLYSRRHAWDLRDVDGHLNNHECHGVFWWLPTDPRLLRLPLGVISW